MLPTISSSCSATTPMWPLQRPNVARLSDMRRIAAVDSTSRQMMTSTIVRGRTAAADAGVVTSPQSRSIAIIGVVDNRVWLRSGLRYIIPTNDWTPTARAKIVLETGSICQQDPTIGIELEHDLVGTETDWNAIDIPLMWCGQRERIA